MTPYCTRISINGILVAVLMAVGLPASAAQQTIYAPNTPITVAWQASTADGVGHIIGYRLWCNKVIVKNFRLDELARTGEITDQTIETTITLGPGSHACYITAYREIGTEILESEPSNMVTFNVGAAPPAPTNFRIVKRDGE